MSYLFGVTLAEEDHQQILRGTPGEGETAHQDHEPDRGPKCNNHTVERQGRRGKDLKEKGEKTEKTPKREDTDERRRVAERKESAATKEGTVGPYGIER